MSFVQQSQRISTDLEDDCAFEYNQHESREETVVPVFVQAPESHTENLEDEERCDSMLGKQLCELWDRDVTGVGAEFGCEVRNRDIGRQRNFGGSLHRKQTGRVLKDGKRRAGVTGVRQGREL